MPFAFELFLDEQSAAPVRQVWEELDRSGIAPSPLNSRNRPHITLAVVDNLPPMIEEKVKLFAWGTPPLTVTLTHVGLFLKEQHVLFAAPTPTSTLLDFHGLFHTVFADTLKDEWDYYKPGHWVPHCSLAMDLSLESAAAALPLCERLALPLHAELVELGIVEFRPVRCICTYPLLEKKGIGG